MAGALQDKIAIVTGGGAGIGEAIARAYAAEGAKVLVAEIDARRGQAVAQSISGFAVATDVTQESSVKDLFAACERRFGRLDILVNNAGVVPERIPAESIDMADWDRVIAINIRGVILCTKYSIELLKRQGGAIVNMSSIAGFKGTPGHSSYSASKFAVRGITEAVAQEVGRFGIRVNSICPGAVKTDALIGRLTGRAKAAGQSVDELIKAQVAPTALGRFIEPAEIAQTAVFLASDRSSAITGEHVRVDVGRR